MYRTRDSKSNRILSLRPRKKKMMRHTETSNKTRKNFFLSSLSSRLEEQGTNASGVPNSTLVAFSYFYLSIVSCLQVDSLQTTLHFLHSLFTSLKEDEHSDDILNKLKASRKVEKSANNFEGSPCLEWNMQEDYNPENTRS